jgi:hypothetical protein
MIDFGASEINDSFIINETKCKKLVSNQNTKLNQLFQRVLTGKGGSFESLSELFVSVKCCSHLHFLLPLYTNADLIKPTA